jgi:hypothetical protein
LYKIYVIVPSAFPFLPSQVSVTCGLANPFPEVNLLKTVLSIVQDIANSANQTSNIIGELRMLNLILGENGVQHCHHELKL